MGRLTLYVVPLLALCFLAVPPDLSAAGKDKLLPSGTVKAVTATSLTVTADGKDSTFTVDAKTNVVGKGIGTKTAAKGGKASITDLLNAGDRVAVTYQEAGATMHAGKVELIAAKGK